MGTTCFLFFCFCSKEYKRNKRTYFDSLENFLYVQEKVCHTVFGRQSFILKNLMFTHVCNTISYEFPVEIQNKN